MILGLNITFVHKGHRCFVATAQIYFKGEAMRTKIALIGAGSVIFAKGLIADVLQMPELSEATICLMDLDATRLKVAETIAQKMVAKLGSKVKIEATLNQRIAVTGAQYVLCTIQVGGYKPGTLIDFEIPKKYGLEQTIGDTIGIGGIFRGLRTIPAINRIAEDIRDYGAPECILLNYTNPMAMNCLAVSRAVGIPHVGLCHSVQGTSKQLASLAGIPYEDVSYLVAGINHMAFFLKFQYKGQDAYPLLFKLLDSPGVQSEKVRFEMMRRLGYFVTESSEHQAEYTPYFIHHGEEIIKQFAVPIDEYLRRCESIIATWHHQERGLVGEGTEISVPGLSHEYGAFIIRAREANRATVIYGSVPNTGLIANLPPGCCVEVPCLVDGLGIHPTVVGALPPQLAAICQTNINVQDLTVEAVLTEKREHIYHAAMLDPHTAAALPLDRIWAMCDELIEAHQKVGLLGEFIPVARQSGRSQAGIGDVVLAKLVPESTLLPDKAEQTNLTLQVENPTERTLDLVFSISTKPDEGKPWEVKVKVGAGMTVSEQVELPAQRVSGDRLELCLSTEAQGVLCLGATLRKRREFSIEEGGEAWVPLELAGFPAADIILKPGKDGIRVEANIFDSKATAPESGEEIWEASCLEVYFADDVPGAKITQVLCGPRPGEELPYVASTFGKESDVQGRSQSIDKMGYQLGFTLTWEALGHRQPPKTLLFDFVAKLSALGDAHSGGRASLNGVFASSHNSSHYAVLKLAGLPAEKMELAVANVKDQERASNQRNAPNNFVPSGLPDLLEL